MNPSTEPAPDSPTNTDPLQQSATAFVLVRYRWPLFLLGLVSIITVTGFLVWNCSQDAVQDTMTQTAEVMKTVFSSADTIAGRFRSGTITETFIASLPRIKGTGSGSLELATLSSTEAFRSEDNLRIWWNYLSLGTTVTEISVPVTYRYHLKLDDSWKLDVSNQTCIVTAPKIRPTIPPSINTGQMVKSSQNGWARFNADDQLEALEKSLTATLTEYAVNEDRMSLIREEARKTVAGFVRNWLLREDQWRQDRFHHIEVRFADEPEPQRLKQAVVFRSTETTD
ncbi:MAG: hypothetical protein M2R45_05306 [Verrucomicrobia subdivision 3 bacterium]|nr:hypothetical protein [Limisphaerales bacterium]MCS1414063.1 hypothetical protein [Limisphaerales bacterium]